MTRIYLKDQSPERKIPGMVEDSLVHYFPYRLSKSGAYLVPSIAVLWKELSETTAIHVAVNPWMRELDWRISSPIQGRLYTVCGDHVDSNESPWYGMPLEMPQGYPGLPACPSGNRRLCMECLNWIDQTVLACRSLKTFLPGRMKPGGVLRARRWKETVNQHEMIQSVMDRIRNGGSTPVAEIDHDGGLQLNPEVEALSDEPDPEQTDRAME